MRNYTIKCISLLLVAFLLVAECSVAKASDENSNTLSGGFTAFIEAGDDVQLIERTGAIHMSYVEILRERTDASIAMGALSLIYGTGTEPDEEKYMEVLINIMRTYEMENASAISEQYKLDNLKSIKDYGMDVLEIGVGLIPELKGMSEATAKLGDGIKVAVNGLATLAGNTDNWIEAISNLETIIQNYAKHDAFLALIEDEADGELKSAAATLRTSLAKAMNVKLATYAKVSGENVENDSEYFFTEVLFTILKATEEYEDMDVRWFVDLGSNVMECFSAVKLGYQIGQFAGNLTVGAENVINRVLEMKAIYDISEILEGELVSLKQEFLEDDSDLAVLKYILYGNYLISCRIRGEYSMYSMLAKDAGLYSLFGDETARKAESIYNQLTSKLFEIKQNLDNIQNVTDTSDLSMYYLSMKGGQYAISGDYKYYSISNGNGEKDLYKENIITGELFLLRENTSAVSINVVNDKVFYTRSGVYDGNGVHMISTDGTGYAQLSDKDVCTLVVDNSYVYFAENAYMYETAVGIKRIAYDAEIISEEVVVPNLSGYVYDMNLFAGKIVYSEVKTAVDANARIIIYDLVNQSKEVINGENSILECFSEMWVHGDYIYILKWHEFAMGQGYENQLTENMKRDLYRYSLTTKEYEVCELPLAEYKELSPGMGYYLGDIYSLILDDFEKELPSDFMSSEKYIFVSAS